MKTKYFTVNELSPDYSDYGHIGTISANTLEELKGKLIEAVSEHFDEDVNIGVIDWYTLVNEYTPIEVRFDTPSISGSVDVRETWIY